MSKEETEGNIEELPKNQKSVFGKIASFIPIKIWKSEWSFAQFKIPDLKSKCTFGPDNTIIVVSSDGRYYLASYDPIKGGECIKKNENTLGFTYNN